MAVVTSASPPHLSSTFTAIENRNPPVDSVARSTLPAEVVFKMNPQPSSPLHAYPDPISNETQMSEGPAYFNARRSQQQSLSQEDQNLANTLSHDMDGQMNVLSPQLTNGQAPNFGMGAQDGMPQTPLQPPMGASIAGQHSGVDPNQDLSYGVGSDRRKRSKVSRACDECRRKKVRCDSTTSDGNVIETCSNCRRLKLTCQFERAPMKRGPSKGYIKELAERVQQVESQIGLPIGYRPSIDAGSPSDPYAEASYSPTEPMSSSRKRTFSQFDTRNPFTHSPHSSREKVTSLSGYSINQAPQGGRGSFALAPDQQLTDISPTAGAPPIDLTKPFWAQQTQQRTLDHSTAREAQDSTALAVDVGKMEPLFSDYVRLIHDEISILPTSYEAVLNHVSKCPQELASTFTFVLAKACGSEPSDGIYASETDFEKYAWLNARIFPSNRSISENVVWLWVYSFMIVNTTADVARLRGSENKLSNPAVLKMAIDLGQYLLTETKHSGVEVTRDLLDSTRNIVLRTWCCIKVLARLHAIGTGTEPSPSSRDEDYLRVHEFRALMSEPAAFLAAQSRNLSYISSQMSISASSRPGENTLVEMRGIIEDFVKEAVYSFAPTSAISSLIRKTELFIFLVLARHTFVNDPFEILDLTLKLTNLLYAEPVNPQDHEPPTAKPLDIHLYSLAGLTLLELIDSEDTCLVKPSQDALFKLRHALEQISERAHLRLQNRFDGGHSKSTQQIHWADVLLQVIQVRDETDQGQRPPQTAPGESGSTNEATKPEQEHSVNGGGPTKETIQVISAEQKAIFEDLTDAPANSNILRIRGKTMIMIDFSLLTRRGYLNVLADLSGF